MRPEKPPLPLPPKEVTEATEAYESESRLDTKFVDALNLEFLVSRTMRKKCLLFNYPVCDIFLVNSPDRLRH